MKNTFSSLINRLLILDVFLVFFGAAWFTVAVIGRSFGIPLGFNLWYKLWQPLFNPAIGILFLGAIINWLLAKLTEARSCNK